MKSTGEPAEKRFTDIPTIDGYIPQVLVGGYEFPFLLCDIDNIGKDLLGWDDPYKSYDFWNLIYDVPIVAKMKRETRSLTTDGAYVADNNEGDSDGRGDASKKYDISRIFSIVGDFTKSD